MSFDPHANLISVTLMATPTLPLSATVIYISNADAAKLDAAGLNPSVNGAFNATISSSGGRNESNSEIIRFVSKGVSSGGNTAYTIVRNAESGGINRPIRFGDQIKVTLTKKTIVDIETLVNTFANQISQKTVITISTAAGADYVCDGVNDEVQFNAAIIAANSLGGAMIFVRKGTYYLGGGIVANGVSKIMIKGEIGTLIRVNSSSVFDAIHLTNTSFMSFFDFELDGNKASYANNYGFSTAGTNSDMLFSNLYVHDCPKDNFHFFHNTDSASAIINCKVKNAGGSGIVITDCNKIDVINCYLSGNTVRDIYHFYSVGGGGTNRVIGCRALSTCSNWNMQSNMANSIFIDNEAANSVGAGGIGASRAFIEIRGNYVHDTNGDDGIAIAGTNVLGGVIANNSIDNCRNYNGIFVGDGCFNVAVTGNRVSNCDLGGIRIWGCTYSTFVGNSLYNNCLDNGGNNNINEIWFGLSTFGGGSYPSQYNTVNSNNIKTVSSYYGIHTNDQDYNDISHNIIVGPTSGILIYTGVAIHNTVVDNQGTPDQSAKTITIKVGLNSQALILNQNDTTNNLAALLINNAGVGSSIEIQAKNQNSSNPHPLSINTTNAFATNVGGSMSFGGYYDTGLQTIFAAIAGKKENSTAGNTRGFLQFTSTGAEVARLTSHASFLLGTTVETVQGGINVNGQIAMSLIAVRNTTSNTAGNTFTFQASGATLAATDKNGGSIIVSGGISTGTGVSLILFKTASPGSTGTTDNSPSTKMTLDGSGRLFVGDGSSPTAILHLIAGTTVAGTAPLKFNSGSLLTTAEAGAVEFLSDAFYGTITSGAARKTFAFLESPVFITPTLGIALTTSINGNAITTGTGTLTLSTFTLTVAGTASISGTNTGDQTTISGNAGSATLTAITDDTTTNATMYPTWVTANSGNLAQKVSSTKLSFNPSTGLLTSVGFVGALTGNADSATLAASATKLTTARAIYGNNFDGTAALTQVIASTYGGTGNGFAKLSGPTTSEKTFTLPDASATILTDNAAVTVAQGGTGQNSYTNGQLLIGNTSGNTLAKATLTGTANQITVTNGAGSITLSTPQNIDSGASPTFVALTLSGASIFTSASAANLIPLTINQNDTTNNPRALLITNTGSGVSLDIQCKTIAGGPTTSANVQIMSTESEATDKGGYLGLGGYSTGTTVQSIFAGIVGRKENGTDANTRGYMALFTTGAEAVRITSNQRVGIGVNAPTAMLHLKAGTATASTAPLKFNSGTNLTTAEAGAMEYDGTDLYFTRTGTTRENVLIAVDNAAAPSTSVGVVIANYYGSSATNYLGTPNRWISVNILGTVYKIPMYT